MKTKSILFALSLLLVATLPAAAQTITGGLVGELSTASVRITRIPNQTYNVIKGNGIMGYAIGGYIKAKAGPFFIKPSLLINFQSGTLVAQNADGVNSDVSFNADKLEIPLMFGLHILGPIYVDAGPVFNQLLFVTDSYDGNTVDVEKSGLGYRFGAGVNISRLSIDVDYEGIRTAASGSLSSYQMPNQIVLGLGVNLGREK